MLYQGCPKVFVVIVLLSQSYLKEVPILIQGCLNVVPKLSQNCPGVALVLSLRCLKVVSRLFHVVLENVVGANNDSWQELSPKQRMRGFTEIY